MKISIKTIAYSTVLAGLLIPTVNAQVLLYNFNDLAGGATSSSENQLSGSPSMSLSGFDLVPAGQAGVAFTDASGTSHSAGLAAAWGSGLDGAGGNSFRLNFDSTGYENFVVSYDYRSTASGSPSAQLSYRVGDSGGFTPFTTQSFTRDGTYHSTSVDLSSLSAIENVSNVALHWDLGAGTGSGTFRLDNVQFGATAVVPEPKEYAFVSGAFLLLVAIRRRYANVDVQIGSPRA